MIHPASITELWVILADTIDGLEDESAVMIVRHDKPVAYLVSPALFDRLLKQTEDLEDVADVQAALNAYETRKAVDAEDAFERLGL